MKFRVVWDQMEECPYLPGQVARLPLRLPPRLLTPEELDIRLELGERRSGRMVYRTQCPACTACEPLRVSVARFEPSSSQRRTWRRNRADVHVEVGDPELSDERLALYNRHKMERGLARSDEPLGAAGYRAWLVDTCVHSKELRYYVGTRLIGVSILDIGRTSVSSVYHYFDPDEARRSLGVYSVLREIAWCEELGIEWYYLGLYVRDCVHLAYKGGYHPHQRRIAGEWADVIGEPE
ncbi:MAG: arginyltransferase [Pseudomonadota bacterium]|nr:arginyltransferase [Pseudomonadota bacterium]